MIVSQNETQECKFHLFSKKTKKKTKVCTVSYHCFPDAVVWT